jgi:hypothetical protein
VDQTYDESHPLRPLSGLVRTVWIQHTGSEPYPQRDLPTGGVELHCPTGGVPRLIGPLTRAHLHVIPPRTTIVGVRFMPGAGTALLGVPADELVDCAVDLWGPAAVAIGSIVRFQGYLALAQAGYGNGLADLAAETGYADHAHLTRECVRLTGVTPRELLGDKADRCDCGHDHSASYAPFLAGWYDRFLQARGRVPALASAHGADRT